MIEGEERVQLFGGRITEEEKKGTRRLRWADCEDNEKERGRQETIEKEKRRREAQRREGEESGGAAGF